MAYVFNKWRGKYDDDYALLADFFSEYPEGNISALYRDFSWKDERRIAVLLVNVLGFQQAPTVQKIISLFPALLSEFSRRLQEFRQDQNQTLVHYSHAFKENKEPPALPFTNFVWLSQQEELIPTDRLFCCIQKQFALKLLMLPLPLQAACMLQLHKNDYFISLLNMHEQRLAEASLILLNRLPASPKKEPVQKQLTTSAMLIRHAAFLSYPEGPISWVDEFILWGRETDQLATVVFPRLKQLKLTHLVVDFVAKPQSPKLEKEIRIHIPFFREYLVNKTLALLSEYSLSEGLKEKLTQELADTDEWRRVLMFFIFELHFLQLPATASQSSITEWINLLFPISETNNAYTRACELKNNLVGDVHSELTHSLFVTLHTLSSSVTAHVMSAFAGIFTFNALFNFSIDPLKKGPLFAQYYEWSNQPTSFPSQLYSFYEGKCKNGFEKTITLSSPSPCQDSRHCLELLLWETLLMHYLPSEGLKTFFDEIFKLERNQQKEAFLCIHRIVFLYENLSEFINTLESEFQELGYNLKRNRGENYNLAEEQSLLKRGLTILEASPIASIPTLNESLHALLVFLDSNYFLRLKEERWNFLYKSIQTTSREERAKGCQELMTFGALVAEKKTFAEFGHESYSITLKNLFLKRIFQAKLGEIQTKNLLVNRRDPPRIQDSTNIRTETCLQELFEDEPSYFAQLTEFQFKVIEKIEQLIEPIPFDTLVIFLLYSPFLPTKGVKGHHFLEALSDYLELKKTERVLKIPNSQILMAIGFLFSNPNFSLSSRDYRLAIAICDDRVDKHKTAIAEKIRQALAAYV